MKEPVSEIGNGDRVAKTPIVAIHLGERESAVAYWNGMLPVVIHNRYNQLTTPSVIWYDRRRGKMVVGMLARHRLGRLNEEVVASIHRKLAAGESVYLGGAACPISSRPSSCVT